MLNDSGGSVAYKFGNLSESFFLNSWYLCPIDLQKYTIPMIAVSQKPAYLEGFAGINFSRETFKKVHFLLFLVHDSLIHTFLQQIIDTVRFLS